MTAVGIIPARYQAFRFPGKALAEIAGVPLIRRVWQAARGAKRLRDALIATDDERIAAACREFGAKVEMTRPDHPTGTDRVAQVAADLSDDIIVNIQADEPLIEGWVIDAAVDSLLANLEVSMSTLAHAAQPEAIDDPNRVKVVLNRRSDALYFSRSRIPALRDAGATPNYWQHIGIYAYRRPFLREFAALARTPAERAEQLEQLRALENGHRIHCGIIEGWRSIPIDTPSDVARVEAALRERNRC